MPWTGAWPSLDLVNLRDSLVAVERLVDRPPAAQPDEVTQALSRFLVVRACGYLEQVAEECCRAYVRSHTTPQVSSYGASWLGRGANPTPDHLSRLVRRFDATWADGFDVLMHSNGDLLRTELSFLVDRRNKIAHGLSEGITGRKALELATYAKQVADWFVVQFDPR